MKTKNRKERTNRGLTNFLFSAKAKELKADRFELPPTLCTKYAATSLPHENVKLEAIYDRSQLNITI